MSKTLVLIDGSSYFYRAFHALPPLTTQSGQPTGAIYGVVNMVKRLIKTYPNADVGVVFDAKGKTFRHQLFKTYKANRARMPDELSCQFEPLIKLLTAMGLPPIIVDGVEADDVIGTLATRAAAADYQVIISTSDKDLAQLVNEHISIINTMTNQYLDSAGVEQKFGVKPEQIVDYLALVGDSADNIPGVSSCGPKTAIKWLNHYQTLDNLIHHHQDIGGKIGACLQASLAQLPLFKELITIKTDVMMPTTLASLQVQPADEPLLIELTTLFEFKSWHQALTTEPVALAPPIQLLETSVIVDIISDEIALKNLCQHLSKATLCAIKLYASGAHLHTAAIIGIALKIDDLNPVYIPLAHSAGLQLPTATVLNALKPLLESSQLSFIGHDLKLDYNLLQLQGIKLQSIIADTMLQSYVLNSLAKAQDLTNLVSVHLQRSIDPIESLLGKGRKQQLFADIDITLAANFAASHLAANVDLYRHLEQQLVPSLKTLFDTIELPLLTIIADIERHGVLIDTHTLATHGLRLKTRIKTLEQQALTLAGKSFNLNSPKQLQDILFTRLKLPIISKTPTGQPSTAESVLQTLAIDYPLPAVIVEYRSLTKLVSTYIDALPKRQQTLSQRVHTCYNQAVTVTGRLSSSDPNLQNIPIRSEEGRLIRTAFIAPKEQVLISADYSQIELRIIAHLSADQGLVQAFARGGDIHAATASDIFQIPLEAVDHEHRRRAKAVNFGLIYGMSPFGLAKQLGISRAQAETYVATYFDRYPQVLAYMEATCDAAHSQGYVETIFGRRLYLPDINARNSLLKRAAERMAINAPMQGSAADIIKKAMIDINIWQQSQPSRVINMVMQVHDELVFEVEKTALDTIIPVIKTLMENTATLAVPLIVSIGTGNNWDEAH